MPGRWSGRPRTPARRHELPALQPTSHHAHEPLGRHALAMPGRAMGFEKIACTRHTGQLPPGTATRMAIRPDIALPAPATIPTTGMGAALGLGGYLTPASTRG